MSMTAGVAAYRDENSSEGQDDCCSSGQLCQTKVPWYRPRESFVLKGPLVNHFPLTQDQTNTMRAKPSSSCRNTPDKVETSSGTLEYKDGAQSKETITINLGKNVTTKE